MAKEHTGPISEFEALVRQQVGQTTAEQVLAGSEQMAIASPQAVSIWLKGAIERLDALVDLKIRVQLMEQMGRNCAQMNRSHIEQALTRRHQFDSLDDFIAAEEKQPSKGTRLLREGNIIYHFYTPLEAFGRRCYCSLWHGLPEDRNAPLTWCECSKAFVATVWEAYAGRPVQVELVESCISGADECKFAVYLD